MAETHAATIDVFGTTAPGRAHHAARSPAIVSFIGIFWLAFVLSNVLAYSYAQSGVNLYYPFVAAFLPYFFLFRIAQVARLALNLQFWLWILTIVIPTLFYYSGQDDYYAVTGLKMRIIFFSILAGSAVVLNAPDARRLLRISSMIVLALAIPICFIELVIPNIFSTAEGRSAGLYMNPNDASAAILICTLFAVDITRQTSRSLLLVSLSAAAVFATFSRSGMLFATGLWAAHAVLPSRGSGALRAPQRAIVLTGLVVVFAFSTVWVAQRVDLSDEAAMRLRSIITGDISDASSARRESFAKHALDLVAKNYSGYGLGAVERLKVNPHNTYLYIGVDYGFPGIVFYLGLLLLGLASAARHGWQQGANGILLSLLLMYASFFTHFVAATTFFGVAFAAILTGALILRPEEEDAGRGVRTSPRVWIDANSGSEASAPPQFSADRSSP